VGKWGSEGIRERLPGPTRDPWPFDPKVNRFPGLIVEHFYVKFGDRSYIGFWDISAEKKTGKQTDKRQWKPYPHDCCWHGQNINRYFEKKIIIATMTSRADRTRNAWQNCSSVVAFGSRAMNVNWCWSGKHVANAILLRACAMSVFYVTNTNTSKCTHSYPKDLTVKRELISNVADFIFIFNLPSTYKTSKSTRQTQ